MWVPSTKYSRLDLCEMQFPSNNSRRTIGKSLTPYNEQPYSYYVLYSALENCMRYASVTMDQGRAANFLEVRYMDNPCRRLALIIPRTFQALFILFCVG